MTTPVPYDQIAAELLPGENVEWSGRPNPSVIFHLEDVLNIPFSLLLGGYAIAWLVGMSGIWDVIVNKPQGAVRWFGILWGTPFVLIGQYLIWGRFVFTRWEKVRTLYVLTNQRALIIVRSWRNEPIQSVSLARVAMIDKQVRNDGNGRISFGGPVTGAFQSERRRPRAPTFDDVDDADTVYSIALQLQARAQMKSDMPKPARSILGLS